MMMKNEENKYPLTLYAWLVPWAVCGLTLGLLVMMIYKLRQERKAQRERTAYIESLPDLLPVVNNRFDSDTNSAFHRLNLGGKVGTFPEFRANGVLTISHSVDTNTRWWNFDNTNYDIGPLPLPTLRTRAVHVSSTNGPSWRIEAAGAPVLYVRGMNDDVPTLVIVSTNGNVITAPHLRWWRKETNDGDGVLKILNAKGSDINFAAARQVDTNYDIGKLGNRPALGPPSERTNGSIQATNAMVWPSWWRWDDILDTNKYDIGSLMVRQPRNVYARWNGGQHVQVAAEGAPILHLKGTNGPPMIVIIGTNGVVTFDVNALIEWQVKLRKGTN